MKARIRRVSIAGVEPFGHDEGPTIELHQVQPSDQALLVGLVGRDVVIRDATVDATREATSTWAAFHRAWSSVVGTPGYSKDIWMQAERQILAAGYGPASPGEVRAL